MRINADFAKRVVIPEGSDDWQKSPAAGVERRLLDRIGDEVARATSIVRYAADSSFAAHTHAMGEEFLVLDGVFSDEHGDYPAGSYVRNPPGSSHVPFSREGCRIFVKLRQFDADDLTPVVVLPGNSDDWHDGGDYGSGVRSLPLHRYESERVVMLRADAGSDVYLRENTGGAEVLIMDGCIEIDGQKLPPESWARFPAGDAVSFTARKDSVVWIKSGHLPQHG